MKDATHSLRCQKNLPLFAVLALFPLSTLADSHSVFFKMEGFNHSEPVSIYQFINNWQGDLYKGDKAVFVNNVELGFTQDNWSFAALYRSDFWMQMPYDSTVFYHSIKNGIPLQRGRTYDVYVEHNYFTATGLKAGYQGNTSGWNWQLDFSYLYAKNIFDGYYGGAALTDFNGDFNMTLDVDYQYYKDILFEREVDNAPSGNGYAIDFAINKQFNDDWQANIEFKDLLAAIHWNQAPETYYQGSATRESGDEFFEYTANTGIERNVDHVQTIPSKILASVHYSLAENHQFNLAYDHYIVKDFIRASYQHTYYRHAFEVGYNFTAGAGSIGYQYSDWLRFEFFADTPQFKDAKTLGGILSVQYRF